MKYDLFYLINEHKNDYTKNSYQILYLLSLSLLIIVSNELKKWNNEVPFGAVTSSAILWLKEGFS